jgi:excisionase family DNA binding protein
MHLRPDETVDPDQLLTVAEVATLLKISQAWVRQHASGFRSPRIPRVKLGSAVRFRRRAVMEFVARLEDEAAC